MNKSFSFSFILVFFCSIIFAQNNINSYKYILVPKQFEFQKSEDQHQLNSLIKFLFNKAGYTVLLTDEQYPEDLANNSCLGLKAKVNNNPGLFKTKMNIDLYDCYNKVIYSTKEATSKEKEYKKAYYEAIRKTFVDLEELGYKYNNKVVLTVEEDIVAEEVPIKKKEIIVKKEKVAIAPKAKTITRVVEKKVVINEVSELKKTIPQKTVIKNNIKTIEGKFIFDKWGISTISKEGGNYVVSGGDENFKFATIYKTSKPTIFIIKWVAYKQPQLVQIDSEGNLKVDSDSGVKTYNRVN